MSICLSDIRTADRPKQGVIKPGVEAELRLSAFRTNLTIVAPPENRHAYVAREIIQRVYGDIARDFEAYLEAASSGDQATADRLRDEIRIKLRGEGHGQRSHAAPDPHHVTRD